MESMWSSTAKIVNTSWKRDNSCSVGLFQQLGWFSSQISIFDILRLDNFSRSPSDPWIEVVIRLTGE
jgi:hypothetical protein